MLKLRRRLVLTFDKLMYPKLKNMQDEVGNELPMAIWSDYNLVHKQMWSSTVTITQECLVLNLIDRRKDQVWVSIDGEVQLVSCFDLEIG